MKFFSAAPATLLLSLCFLPHAGAADELERDSQTCTRAGECVSKSLVDNVRHSESQRDVRNMLDSAMPDHWNTLSQTGKMEAVETIWERADDDLDADLIINALRFARVNDAIFDAVSTNEIVRILQPKLEDDLGYGRGTPNSTLRAVTEEIVEHGNGRHGTYESYTSYRKAYSRAISRYRSGQ